MIKKIAVIILILVVAAGAAVYIYRYTIIQYSVETAIRNNLPGYLTIDNIRFNSKESRIIFNGLAISNAPGFSAKHIVEIDEMSCKYRLKGRNILDGLEIVEPVFTKMVLNIERFDSGRLNINEMQAVLAKTPAKNLEEKGPEKASNVSGTGPGILGSKKISDIIKLPEVFIVKNGSIVFTDRAVPPNPKVISFDNIQGQITLRLNDSYTEVMNMGSEGEGIINGHPDEKVRWVVAINPNTPKLTMSNRFEVSGLKLPFFEPYYDKYSPFIFKEGKFSGTLIFDFDNGNIGSTNEVHLSDLNFSIKPGMEKGQFWQTTVPDLAKYFTSSYGDIVFDFKIKGDIKNPEFLLGPISKKALTIMAVDKVSEAIAEAMSKTGDAGVPKADGGKAKDYIDLFKELTKKK